MNWKIFITKKAAKQIRILPPNIQRLAFLLLSELEISGPYRNNWHSYGQLKDTEKMLFHCHLKCGKPTYVACWEIKDKKLNFLEVYYVGTHEKAPY